MPEPKSYRWTPVSLASERDRAVCRSWFAPLCDDMTPIKAEVLCDTATDRSKKLRVVMMRPDGRRHIVERTVGGNTWRVTLGPVEGNADA